MTIRELNNEEIIEVYEHKMQNDFIKEEIKPLERILKLCEAGKYFCYGIFHQENGKEDMISYCFLASSDMRDAVLLDYFAVSGEMRGMGYGSRCFYMLKEEIQKKNLGNLILEVENPRYGRDEKEKDLRRRRIAFYIRNGMTLTHLRIFLYDVEYLVMTADSGQMFQAAEQIYHVYQVLLKPDKIKTRLKISTNIRCIVTDLDRTALNEQGKLSERTKAAIKAAEGQGIRLVIASGRAYDTLPEEVKAIAETGYTITSNGAVVSRHGERVRCSILDASVAEHLLKEYAHAKKKFYVTMEVFIKGKAYCDREYYENPEKFGSKTAAAYVHMTRNAVDDIGRFAKEHKAELDSITFISAQVSEREKLKLKLTNEFQGISVTSSIEHLIEIAPEHVSKGSALEWILMQTGIEPEECAAFGDGDNDASMLSYAGIGIAVENASYLAKNAANYVTKSHKMDGVAVVVEEILQILQN